MKRRTLPRVDCRWEAEPHWLTIAGERDPKFRTQRAEKRELRANMYKRVVRSYEDYVMQLTWEGLGRLAGRGEHWDEY